MTLFLGWSGSYAREIAEALKVAIDQLCIPGSDNTPAISTWLSSVDIEAGLRWRSELDAALSDANIGIVVVTQEAIDSHWLPHEAGALSNRCSRLVILLADAPQTVLPDPLKEYQYATLANQHLAALLRNLAGDVNASGPSPSLLKRLYEDIQRIRGEHKRSFVTSDNERWKNKFERLFAISMQRDSPYDLEQLLNITQRRLVLVAQNHYYMTKPGGTDQGDAKFWPLVKDLLNRKADLDIVAMHTEATPPPFPEARAVSSPEITPPDALALWSCYMRSSEFLRHVRETWETLRQWDLRYQELRSQSPTACGVLRLWTAYFTPVTMSFRDPEQSGGLLVLSPRMGHEANDSRPQFIVKRSTCPTAFAYYWGTVDNGFNNGGWRCRNA
jgi:hypothetical protein